MLDPLLNHHHLRVSVAVDLLIQGLKDVRVTISMMVLCNAGVVAEHDRRRSKLPNAPVDVQYDENSTE